MRSVIVADNKETVIGLRLAGVDGRLIKNDENVMKLIDELISDENIGIIIPFISIGFLKIISSLKCCSKWTSN